MAEYKMVTLYIIPGDHMMIVPYGRSKRYGLVMLSDFTTIPYPTDDACMVHAVLEGMGTCGEKMACNPEKCQTALERFRGMRGIRQSTVDVKMVVLSYDSEVGYHVEAMKRQKNGGYLGRIDDVEELGFAPSVEEIASAIHRAISIATV